MNAAKSDYTSPFEVFFDGKCPLCMAEINMIRKMDRARLVIYTDIARSDFDGPGTVGLTFDTLMARIHGRLSDGTIIEGVEVFRQLYARTVLRPLIPLTRIPGVRGLLDVGYVCFAWLRYKSRGGQQCRVDEACRLPVASRVEDR